MSPDLPTVSAPVRDLGRREYVPVWELMKQLRRDRKSGKIPDTLILVEHPPVITVGVQGSDGEELPPDLPVHQVERGGKGTYHGPGQLVGYAIVSLDGRGRDVRRFVHDLEEMVVRCVASFGLPASRVPGRRGVWIQSERKIASVGVAIEEWVSYHGFALNVSTDLSIFRRFRPCGLEGSVMTSLEKELGRAVSLEDVKPRIVDSWEQVFGGGARVPGDPLPTGVTRGLDPAPPTPATAHTS